MSESKATAEIFFILGIISLFAVLLYGLDAGPALISTPVTPSFNNPFNDSPEVITKVPLFPTIPWDSASVTSRPTVGTHNGCGNDRINYWKCIRDSNGPDLNQSYIKINPSFSFFRVNLTGNIVGTMRSYTVYITCLSNISTALSIFVQLQEYDGSSTSFHGGGGSATSINGPYVCKSGPIFTTTSITVNIDSWFSTSAELAFDIWLSDFTLMGDTNEIQVTTVSIEAIFSDKIGTTACSGDNYFNVLGCQLTYFIDFLSPIGKGIQFIINIFIFAGQWIWLGIVFISNFFVILAWLFAIPDMPFYLQAFVDVFLLAVFGSLLLKIVQYVRGSGA